MYKRTKHEAETQQETSIIVRKARETDGNLIQRKASDGNQSRRILKLADVSLLTLGRTQIMASYDIGTRWQYQYPARHLPCLCQQKLEQTYGEQHVDIFTGGSCLDPQVFCV